MALTLDAIRACLEGGVPSRVATCAADGTPNVTYVSQVHYVDRGARRAVVPVLQQDARRTCSPTRARRVAGDPPGHRRAATASSSRYLRTETAGPLFESMKAKLAGIASHTGMSGRVPAARLRRLPRARRSSACPGSALPAPPPAAQPAVGAARAARADGRLRATSAALLDDALAASPREFGIDHAMVLMLDGAGQRLYTVASRGYAALGRRLGDRRSAQGVIGVAAARAHADPHHARDAEYAYGRAIRESVGGGRHRPTGSRPRSRSRASPSRAASSRCRSRRAARLLGVLYVESPAGPALRLRRRGRAGRARRAARRWRSTSCSRRAESQRRGAAAAPGTAAGGAARRSSCATTPPTTASSSATTT